MSRIGHDAVHNEPKGERRHVEPRDNRIGVLSGISDGAVAGAVTGAVSRMAVQPFDVLKIRFQLQAESRAQAKYKSLLAATRSIAREEGVRALWKGHVSGQWLSVLFAGTSFGIYQALCDRAVASGSVVRVSEGGSKAKTGAMDVVFGTLAGIPATIISFPFDVVRTRMVGQGGPSKSEAATKAQYKTMTQAFIRMVTEEGAASLYKVGGG